MKYIRPILRLVFVGAFAWVVFVTWRVISFARIRPLTTKAEVALVLGASAPGGAPSPVFVGRIDYAIELFQSGHVRAILFTGGHGKGEPIADAQAAKTYAIGKGVPADRIWIETTSHTTRQNLAEARRLLKEPHSVTCLLVSDPLHMFRSISMMQDEGLTGTPAPSPYTRIRSLTEKIKFLGRELWLYHAYLMTGE